MIMKAYMMKAQVEKKSIPCKGRNLSPQTITNIPLKARDVTLDSTFMFRINANDYACVIISQYLCALQSNNIVVVTHAYSYQFQLPAGSSTRNETPYLPVRENIEHRFLPLIIMCGLGQVLSAPVVNSKRNLV